MGIHYIIIYKDRPSKLIRRTFIDGRIRPTNRDFFATMDASVATQEVLSALIPPEQIYT